MNAPRLHKVLFRSSLVLHGDSHPSPLSEEPWGGRRDFCPAVTWGLPWLQRSQAQNDRAEWLEKGMTRSRSGVRGHPGHAWNRCAAPGRALWLQQGSCLIKTPLLLLLGGIR